MRYALHAPHFAHASEEQIEERLGLLFLEWENLDWLADVKWRDWVQSGAPQYLWYRYQYDRSEETQRYLREPHFKLDIMGKIAESTGCICAICGAIEMHPLSVWTCYRFIQYIAPSWQYELSCGGHPICYWCNARLLGYAIRTQATRQTWGRPKEPKIVADLKEDHEFVAALHWITKRSEFSKRVLDNRENWRSLRFDPRRKLMWPS